jgi:hypothetical protein
MAGLAEFMEKSVAGDPDDDFDFEEEEDDDFDDDDDDEEDDDDDNDDRSDAEFYRAPTSASRYVMRVDLKGAKPPIWRRLSLPIDASFFDLHAAIQDAMGWHDSHLHCFEIAEGREILFTVERNTSTLDAHPMLANRPKRPELRTTLREVVGRGHKTIRYVYDFGDDWVHDIKIEKTLPGATANPLPELLGGRGICPSENCGGILGWHALLDGDHPFIGEMSAKELEKLRAATFDPKEVRFRPARERLDGPGSPGQGY